MKNKTKYTYVQQKITHALIELLETHDIDELSISDITAHAGVSRASFYRNFDTKRDVLTTYLHFLIEDWGREFEKLNDISKFSESLLTHYYDHKEIYLLLYRRNLSGLVYEQIRLATHIEESESHAERYGRSTIAGLIFGVIDEWMRLGMIEPPSQMLVLLANPS